MIRSRIATSWKGSAWLFSGLLAATMGTGIAGVHPRVAADPAVEARVDPQKIQAQFDQQLQPLGVRTIVLKGLSGGHAALLGGTLKSPAEQAKAIKIATTIAAQAKAVEIFNFIQLASPIGGNQHAPRLEVYDLRASGKSAEKFAVWLNGSLGGSEQNPVAFLNDRFLIVNVPPEIHSEIQSLLMKIRLNEDSAVDTETIQVKNLENNRIDAVVSALNGAVTGDPNKPVVRRAGQYLLVTGPKAVRDRVRVLLDALLQPPDEAPDTDTFSLKELDPRELESTIAALNGAFGGTVEKPVVRRAGDRLLITGPKRLRERIMEVICELQVKQVDRPETEVYDLTFLDKKLEPLDGGAVPPDGTRIECYRSGGVVLREQARVWSAGQPRFARGPDEGQSNSLL